MTENGPASDYTGSGTTGWMCLNCGVWVYKGSHACPNRTPRDGRPARVLLAQHIDETNGLLRQMLEKLEEITRLLERRL